MAKFICNFISYSLKRAVDITVIIPSVTFPEACGDGNVKGAVPKHGKMEKYPVIYLLHGVGNDHATWNSYTSVELFVEERNIAVVMLSAENKMYVNHGGNSFMGDCFYDFIEEELPDFICGMFPVSERPEDTYIAGLSMGAFGTMIHGLKNPQRYRAMGAFSAGLFLPPTEAEKWDPEYNPLVLTEKLSEKKVKDMKIFMGCGDKDPLFEGCRNSAEILKQSGQDVTWVPVEGYAHEWRLWNLLIERYMDWIPRTDYFSTLGIRKI